jgi:hypothetical protein
MEGVVSYGLHHSDPLKQFNTSVLDARDLAVLDDIQPLQLCTECDAQALEAETDAKYRDHRFGGKIPQILDNSYILVIFRRAWAGADDDSGEEREEREDLRDIEGIVLDNIDGAVRY